MSKLTKLLSVSFEPCPKEVAILFCSMDGSEQAQFFNEVAELNTKELNAGRIAIMRQIGEYGEEAANGN